MEQSNQDLMQRFNEVYKHLSKPEQQKIVDVLKPMSPEQRSVAVRKIVEHYEPLINSKKEVAAVVSNGASPVNQSEVVREVPKAQETAELKRTVKPIEVVANDKKSEAVKTSKPKPKKKLKKGVKAFIAIVVVLAILLGIGAYSYLNQDKVKTLLGIDAVTTDVYETSVEGTAETTAETSETTPQATESTEPSPTPGPTNVPVLPGAPDLTGLVIVLDPGHQEVADEETEICASWLSISKPRCTAGAFGTVTGTPEYDLTLQYCLIIRNYLEQCGATVILTRETNDVSISNQERANIAVVNEADLFIRVHCDSANDGAATGVRVYVPDTGSYTSNSISWGDILGESVATAEGLTFDGTRDTYLYTGLNYANTIPSFQISLGFLSNADNEAILLNPDNELRVAEVFAEFCSNFL